jgi:peptidoglycan/LPS O-acetylase OafA/YrhL
MLIVGLYLGGAPAIGNSIENYRNAFGWHYLSYLRPSAVFNPKAFYLFWGALLVVAAIPKIQWLKSFFELRGIQYLGKISYAFYLVHGPVLWTLGDRVYAAVGWTRMNHGTQIPGWVDLLRLPAWGPVGLEFNFLCAHIVLLPTTLWLAGLMTKAVDEPVLKLISQGYRRLCTESKSESLELIPA